MFFLSTIPWGEAKLLSEWFGWVWIGGGVQDKSHTWDHARSGTGCEQACLLHCVWDGAPCRLYVLPRMINTSIFSCYPFGLHDKQVALIDVYSFQKVNMCLKEVWMIPLFLCGLLVFCQLLHGSSKLLPPLLCLSEKHVNWICLGWSFLLLHPASQELHSSKWMGHSRFTPYFSAETVWEICFQPLLL